MFNEGEHLPHTLLDLGDVTPANDVLEDDLKLWGRHARSLNFFKVQKNKHFIMVITVSGLSLWVNIRVKRRSWSATARGMKGGGLPDQAGCFHTGGFHNQWQTLGHCHWCPARWWGRCLFRSASGPLREKQMKNKNRDGDKKKSSKLRADSPEEDTWKWKKLSTRSAKKTVAWEKGEFLKLYLILWQK